MTMNKNPVDDDIKAKAAQRNHHDWLSFVQTGGIAIQRSVYRECWQAYTNYMHKLRCLLIDDRINMQMIKNQRCCIENEAGNQTDTTAHPHRLSHGMGHFIEVIGADFMRNHCIGRHYRAHDGDQNDPPP